MGYCFIDGIAEADVAFRAWGEEMEETFAEAARATMRVMVENLDSIAFRKEVQVVLAAGSAELLLFDFLQEFIFHKDAGRLLLLPESVSIVRDGEEWELSALLGGERIDPGRHSLLVDVKAVTLHGFSLRRTGSGWEARVVLDV